MLSNHLGYDAVPYFRVGDSNVIECENFVKDGYWFEPMFSILGDEEDYEYNYSVLSNKRLEGLLKECNKLVADYVNKGRLRGTKNKLILSIINSLDFRFRHDRFIYYSVSVIILSKIDNS